MLGGKREQEGSMAMINRKFYQSWRGPTPADQDSWSLVFDPETRRLLVRHEWQTSGHDGFDEWEVAEFLQQDGDAQTALVESLFLVPADA
jgi:chitinase